MSNIKIVTEINKYESSKKGFNVLKKMVSEQTLLLLSGGTSPDVLYQMIARDASLRPGAVALVDERFGPKMHDNSNEKMIAGTGLSEYLIEQKVPYYPILVDGLDLEETALNYEQTLRELFGKYPRKVAIMGIGSDGHTAGIKPNLIYDHSRLVIGYDDQGKFGKRVTITFEALENIDQFIILMFGEEKRKALEQVLSGVNQEILPAAFFRKGKSIIYTDLQDISQPID